ncbi:MAG: 23S rRNA (uracil(1939)-C(5))-methyltransferase RlmD [Chitinophagales bacterium]|nr:23S rRNA (uracil(1939)-C(5))-methyltransferase RlmD [Chitinophagales bacterium]
MARKIRNRSVVIDGLKIEKMASKGRGIGYADDKIVFVDYGVPGDVLKVKTTVKKKDYVIATIEEVEQGAEYRQNPVCEHFGICGGCRWQHVPYAVQLEFKQQLVEDAFRHIGHLKYPALNPILGAPEEYHYRNKTEYTFTDKAWLTPEEIESGREIDRRALGFHVPGRFDGVMQIHHCHLQDSLGDEIRNSIYQYALDKNLSFYNMKTHEGFLRNLILRNNIKNEWMLTLSVGIDDTGSVAALFDHLQTLFPQIISYKYVFNPKQNDTLYDLEVVNYSGNAYLTESFEDIQYKISPKSFFQTNTRQAKNLYDVVKRMATIHPEHLVYDLYTGTGTIALYVAKSAKKVIGIETVDEAIKDAKFNARLNEIENVEFISASVERILDEDFIKSHGKPNVVITDPPRVGMHKDVLDILLKASPQQIVYVSCNPDTQARDLSILCEKYDVVEIQPVDMFPQTYHIENVVNLIRR